MEDVDSNQTGSMQEGNSGSEARNAIERARKEMLSTMQELEGIKGLSTTVGDGDERIVFLNTPITVAEEGLPLSEFDQDALKVLDDQLKDMKPEYPVDLMYHVYLAASQQGFTGISLLSEIRQQDSEVRIEPKTRSWSSGNSGNLVAYEEIFKDDIRDNRGSHSFYRLSVPKTLGIEGDEPIPLNVHPAERRVYDLERDFAIYKREQPEITSVGDQIPKFDGSIQTFMTLETPLLATQIIDTGLKAIQERQNLNRESEAKIVGQADTTSRVAQQIRSTLPPRE